MPIVRRAFSQRAAAVHGPDLAGAEAVAHQVKIGVGYVLGFTADRKLGAL
jgi:hypothetical protein